MGVEVPSAVNPVEAVDCGSEFEGDTMDEIITLKAAAEILDVSVGTMYRMAERGELPGAAKVRGQWRVNRAALLQGLGLAVAS